jgi:hypothetical protein
MRDEFRLAYLGGETLEVFRGFPAIGLPRSYLQHGAYKRSSDADAADESSVSLNGNQQEEDRDEGDECLQRLATLLGSFSDASWGCLNVNGVLRPKIPKRKRTSTKVCSWSISDVKMKARFWPSRHKSIDYLKGPKSMQRRDEGRSFGKPLVVYRNSMVSGNTNRVGYGGWGLIANGEASIRGRLPREHVSPQFSADQFVETKPDSVSTMAGPAQHSTTPSTSGKSFRQ